MGLCVLFFSISFDSIKTNYFENTADRAGEGISKFRSHSIIGPSLKLKFYKVRNFVLCFHSIEGTVTGVLQGPDTCYS